MIPNLLDLSRKILTFWTKKWVKAAYLLIKSNDILPNKEGDFWSKYVDLYTSMWAKC